MRRRVREAALLGPLAVWLVFGTACAHLGYYARTVRGGLEVLTHRRPIDAVLADPATPPHLAERLRLVQRIRRFAVGELSLPDDKSYTRYTDLDREAAVWTVVAAPELSVQPVVWCFLVVGCVSYRGYFSEAAAERFAALLDERGYDVAVDGRAAYSTLGHFADPVLSTFLDYEEPRLAGLIFHELAHRRVYVPGDTAFNESFATAVELAGVERWLEITGSGEEGTGPGYRARQRLDEQITALYLAARDRLEEVYAADAVPPVLETGKSETSDAPDLETLGLDGWKRRRKAEVFDGLRRQLRRLGVEPAEPLNNGRLASLGPYHRWLAAFEALLARHGGDLATFYRRVERLARLPEQKRHEALEELDQLPEPSQESESETSAGGPSLPDAISRSLSSAFRLSGSSSSDLR